MSPSLQALRRVTPEQHGSSVSRGKGGRAAGLWAGLAGRAARSGPSESERACVLADRFRPGFLDPIRRRSQLVVGRAGLRPVRRRADVADRNGDDPVGVEDRERIFGHLFEKPVTVSL